MGIPITQTKMWQKLQDDLGETSFFTETQDYQYLAILKHTPVGNYLYLPYGPVVHTDQGTTRALQALEQLARRHHAIFIRIEPQDPQFKLPANARQSLPLNPPETWVLDLSGNESDLKAKLPSRLLRYYHGAAKKGITIETSHNPDDIRYLLKLQSDLAKAKGISTFSEEYLRTELSQPFATLYLVKYHETASVEADSSPQNSSSLRSNSSSEPSVIAAGLVFDDATTRYNLQGAQSAQGRSLHATGILTIQLILDAKAKQLKTFDFWGIAPDGAPEDHPWAGFTNFKKTFAGTTKSYLGTYDLILNPVKYRLYQLFRKLRRML